MAFTRLTLEMLNFFPRIVRTVIALASLTAILLSLGTAQESAVESRFRHGTDAMRSGSLDEAESDFLDVIRVAPQFAEAYLNLGLVQEQQAKYEQSIASLQHALKLKPALRGANLFLGLAHYRLAHYEPSLIALRKETKLNPGDPKAWMWLGVVELVSDQVPEATEALDRAAKLAPDDVDILYHQGRAHMLMSKQSYQRMFKVDPESWRIRLVLAQANAEADRDQDAVAEYEAAIKLSPSEPGLHEELGSELWKMGKSAEAQAAYQQELQLDPNSLLATYKLGVLKVLDSNPAEAKVLLQKALAQRPKLSGAYYYLGRAELQVNNQQAALDDFQRTIQLDSGGEITRQAYYQMAQLYRKLHRSEDAEKALATFQKLKQEAADQQSELFEKKRKMQEQNPEELPATVGDQN